MKKKRRPDQGVTDDEGEEVIFNFPQEEPTAAGIKAIPTVWSRMSLCLLLRSEAR